MRFLIKQAVYLPLIFFIPVLISGALVADYSAISQHASEITLTDNTLAKTIVNAGAIFSGISCLLFSLGLILYFNRACFLSGGLIFLFGLSMISNGVFPMGDPMHGIYGVGLVLIIIPFVMCYEFKGRGIRESYFSISIVSGLCILVYFWAMLAGMDSVEYRGLTQRLISLVIFGWFAYSSYEIGRIFKEGNH